jgi:hypothetical protein
MAVDITRMRAYTDGAVYSHAVGATITAPTDASSALDVDFVEVGAVSEDGIKESTSQDRTDVFIWQGATLARRIPGQFTKTFTFAAAETSIFNLRLNYAGSTVSVTGEGASVAEKAPATDIRAWVLHGTDGSTRKQRIYLPAAEITERGDVVWSSGEVTVYEWTLSAYTDTNSVVAYRYYAGIS